MTYKTGNHVEILNWEEYTPYGHVTQYGKVMDKLRWGYLVECTNGECHVFTEKQLIKAKIKGIKYELFDGIFL